MVSFLSLRANRKSERVVRYDWSALKEASLGKRYGCEISNRFDILRNIEDSPTELYQKLIDVNTDVTDECVPKLSKSVRKAEISDHPNIQATRSKLEEAYKQHTLDPKCHERRERVEVLKADLHVVYGRVREEEMERAVSDINHTYGMGKMRKVWNLVNNVSGKKKGFAGKISGGSVQERLDSWKRHFKGLLGKEPCVSKILVEEEMEISEELPISVEPFTYDEYWNVVKRLDDGKGAGADGIRPEALKRGGNDLHGVVLGFCNRALEEGDTPSQWSELNIIPVPKSGSLTNCDNYRGISMCSVVTKVLNKMILLKIRPELEKVLRCNQNGFRPGRGTTPHILALRRLLEGVRAKSHPAVIIFVDFRKAFDSVDRTNMFTILKAYGIPDKILQLIKSVYDQTTARVISPDGITELFRVLAGILQGDTLAPYLFIIIVDYILCKAFKDNDELGFTVTPGKGGRRSCNKALKVKDLDYADDLAALADNIQGAQEMFRLIEDTSAQVGLYVNAKKTQFMTANIPVPKSIKAKDGTLLKEVSDYKYLGAWVASSMKDFKVRRALAWVAAHKLKSIWTSSFSNRLKINLMTAVVESILLYGSEIWTFTKELTSRVDGVYTRLLRFCLNVSWKDKWTNEKLYHGLPKVTEKIKARRLRLAGHCVRHGVKEDADSASVEVAGSLVLWEPTQGKRRVGGQHYTYRLR